jgi:PKD domain
MKRALCGCAGLTVFMMIAASAIPAIAHPVSGNLPGGTNITVSIDAPADGAVVPQGVVTVTGTASVGQGQAVPNTALVYVLDVSSSTQTPVSAGCGGDQNGDGDANNILDCEVLAAKALNDEALSPGTAGTIPQVGAAGFADGAVTADVGPAANDQLITGPGTDADGTGGRDINQVLNSAFRNTGQRAGFHRFTEKDLGCCRTNFAAGIVSATQVAAAVSPGLRRLVVFLSDGLSTGEDISPALANVPGNVDFFTFAVGTDSQCESSGTNSLQRIADATGGTCTEVPNVADLPNILPSVINSQLSSLSLRVDGGAATPITNVTPALPRPGPASVSYTVNTAPLGPGIHQLCVTANGSDGGGPGSVMDCHTIRINSPPQVNAGGPYSGQEGTAVQIAGSFADPDGPSSLTTWTIAPGPNVDPGTTCSFEDTHSLATFVRCTDDGTFTLTLTGNDGLNPPVSVNTTLTLFNVAPAVTISAPADNSVFRQGASVSFTAPFTDIGTNDTHTCTFDFNDGTTVANGSVTETPGSGTCAATHPFTVAGTHNVLVTVRDDDGGSATAVVRVIINGAPVVTTGGPYSGQEGSAVSIAGAVADLDSSGVSTLWTIAPQSGVDSGASCSFGNASAAATSVTCTDDGVYTLTLTADDHVNAPVSASTTLTLSNVAPATHFTAPADGAAIPNGGSVSFTAPFTDDGRNDTHTCTLNFDDGSPVANGTVSETPGTGTCTATHTFTVSGTHTVVVTVRDDDGGTGSDSVRVVVNSPPVVSAGGPYSGQEGATISIAGSVTDPDGPNLSQTWTIAPQSGVDPGATCAFGDASAVSTTVRCTDDGTFTLTLTGTDGFNPPVAKSTTLTLFNVAPEVHFSAPANGSVVATGAPVAFTAPFTEAGTNDTHTCTFDFDDGTPIADGSVTETPGSGTCAGSHPFTVAGTHNVLVTVVDDDGASGTAVVRVVVNAPPVVRTGGPFTGQEGSAVSITGTVTDPDGPGLTTAWSIIPASGVDAGATCAFGDAAAVSTTVTCTDDGTFTLRLTANDGVNAPVVASTTLTLTNVAPAVTISAPANGSLFVRGTTVSFTAPFTDAGKNDTHTCTVNFGDATPVVTGTVTENAGSGACTTSHAFTALGPHDVLVTVRDDDGGVGTATVRVVIFLPAEAWAISASGVVTIAKTPHAVCPPDATLTTVGVNLPGVVNTGVLNASCTIDPATGTTRAVASVDNASLLGGLITIGAIQTSCVAGADGIVGSSRVGTINGTAIGTRAGSISIPLVATVFFNQTINGPNGQLTQHAIRVVTLLGQEIILAGCRVG